MDLVGLVVVLRVSPFPLGRFGGGIKESRENDSQAFPDLPPAAVLGVRARSPGHGCAESNPYPRPNWTTEHPL